MMSKDNKKTVYITENQLQVIQESKITFWRFFTDVKTFLGKLLKGDLTADISDSLKSIGLTRDSLINKLMDIGLLKRKEDIREYSEELNESKEKARYYVTYTVVIPHFRRKLLDLFDKLIKKQ